MHFQCLLHKVAVISGTKILLFPYLCCTMAKKPFTPIPPMAELPPAEEINAAELLDKYLSGEIDLICVLGPTASGKTRYAVRLARQINTILEDYAAIKPGDCGHRGPCHPRHESGGTTSEAQWWGERSERPSPLTSSSRLSSVSASTLLNSASPREAKISATLQPSRSSMAVSRSIKRQQSSSESLFPTLLLPQPMNPVNDIIILF